MATAEPLSTPISRLQSKKPDFYRLNRSKSSEGRRKTAAERLEADKLKYYVKSSEARQKQTTPGNQHNNAGLLRNVQSTGALSHYDTAAVNRENENRNGNAVINDTVSTGGQFDESRTKLNRSKTDADVAGKNPNRFRTRSTAEQAINSLITSSKSEKTKDQNPSSSEHISKRSRSPKDKPNPKSFLNKAKESLKSVTSSFTGSGGMENLKTRQSRPAVARSSCQRSHSAGANIQRHLNTRLTPPSNQYNSEILAVSPRTQLKNARQNLKKISHTDENKNGTKLRGKTFVIKPKQNVSENKERVNTYELLKLPQNTSCTSFSLQRSSNQPLSTIDNTVSSSRSCVSSNDELAHKNKESAFSRLHVSKSITMREEKLHKIADTSTSIIANETNNHTLSAFKRLKGSSESTNNHQHVASLSHTALFAPIQDSTTPYFSNVPRQRKSCSRAPVYDLKKSSNRVSFNEETLTTRPESRKSLTEALEEIINPPDCEDDMDTAYHSMSPDASVECKTLLAAANQPSTDPIATVSSGAIFRGTRSKTPESSRSRTPIFDDGISFGANDVDLSAKDSEFPLFVEQSKSGKSSMTSSSQYKHSNSTNNETVSEMRHNVHKIINESDARVMSSNGEDPSSTMLAPKERKEVAPDFSMSSKPDHLEHLNTMKSQNTLSSTSGDINKPLTALTAADLKPRGGIRFGLPLKPKPPQTVGVSNCKANVKRPNNTPISPTTSPNKQAARMTPSQGSTSSTPYSSLKRTPASSHSSSLKRNRQRSKSDVSILQSELDRFFSTMGMDDSLTSPYPGSQDTLFTTAPIGSESDFSFAGASAYVRGSIDGSMDVEPAAGGLANAPSVSIIEKNARVMRWLRSCNKPAVNTSPRSSKRAPTAPIVPPRPIPPPIPDRYPLKPPPIPPRLNSLQTISPGATKISDV